MYDRHIAGRKRKGRGSQNQSAIGIRAGKFLVQQCIERKPCRILDLGSGYSTLCLAAYCEESGFECQLTSVETSLPYLLKIRSELESEDLWATTWQWDDIGRPPTFEGYWPFIFYDMGSTSLRVANMELVASWLTRDGLLVLDDWHMPHYRKKAAPRLLALGMKVEELDWTDEFSRRMALAHW